MRSTHAGNDPSERRLACVDLLPLVPVLDDQDLHGSVVRRVAGLHSLELFRGRLGHENTLASEVIR